MKYRPTDAELLDAIARLLEDEVMAAVPPALQHKVRVAANLTRILERQQAITPQAEAKEHDALQELLNTSGSLDELRAELDRRIRGDEVEAQAAWDLLVATAKDDLAAAKPGYTDWQGG